MSTTLAGAGQLSFKATRHTDAGLIMGRDVPEDLKIEVLAQRPNKIVVESVGPDSARSFYADGRTATLVDRKMNFYAIVPMKTTIDGLVAQLDARFGFTPLLADFLVSNPYKGMSKQIKKSSVTGTESVAWTKCYRLALVGELADADLWVGVKDHLPRRLVATFKKHDGSPQLRVNFSSWNLVAAASDKNFVFILPQGAQKIAMISTADSGKAHRKSN